MTQRKREEPSPLFAALEREIQARPRGTISQMEQALGWKTSWWQNRRRRTRDLDTQTFLAILDFLGLDPVGFVRETLGTEHGLELDEPQGPAPELVEQAWERFRSGNEREGLGPSFLRSLDEKGYRDPRAALEFVQSSIDLASLQEIPALLGTAGSALRAKLKFQASGHCFYAAIHGALLLEDHRMVGNLLRRFSYLLADNGQFERALVCADRAVGILAREDDEVGLAKGCVEQGQWLYQMNRREESIAAFRTALRRLPESEPRYRCAAYQWLGLVCKDAGELEQAVQALDAAQVYLDALAFRDNAKVLWLAASVHEERQDLGTAVELLRKVVEMMLQCHHGEAALATCDLVRTLLKLGEPVEAFNTATTMRALVEPLARNPVISAAIAELLRCGREGLTLTLVSRVQGQIGEERKNRTRWHSLKT